MRKYLTLPAFFLTIISSAVMVLAYPPFDIGLLAWIGLVPFFLALQGMRRRSAFKAGFLFGNFFFAGTLFWFFHLTRWFSFWAAFGVILLFIYLSLYTGLFAMCYSWLREKNYFSEFLVVPSLWCLFEFSRGHLFSGFGWVALGHSQYQYLPVIQMADVTGVPGISFLIVAVNMAFTHVLLIFFRPKKAMGRRTIVSGAVFAGLIVSVAVGYGLARLGHYNRILKSDSFPSARIAVIQGNISQEMKWNERAWDDNLNRYREMTENAALLNPDLIIWPESVLPGFINEDPEVFDSFARFVRGLNVPFITGAVVKEREGYYNSALLVDESGTIVDTYHKIHLVPFGEYFPLRPILFPIANAIGTEDFLPGKSFPLFPLRDKTSRALVGQLSTLICFEDTVPWLSRTFVARGAGLLVNITNDGWFRDSPAARLHLQNAIFRAVENRRYLVRAANTGESAYISPTGFIYNWVKDSKRDTVMVKGFSVADVKFLLDKTFYSLHGDIFVLCCSVLVFLGIVLPAVRSWLRKRK